MKSFQIFTVCSGSVTEGAEVTTKTLAGAGINIPVICVGEEGRGRRLSYVPVDLPKELFKEWQEKGNVRLFFAEIGTTKAGKPKLFGKEGAGSNEQIIVVFRTMIGFRGSNNHTGDIASFEVMDEPKFMKFPGEILCTGIIAEGDAGRMGSGEQIISVLPKEKVFRTSYGGRLYGEPAEHYYRFNGQSIQSLTWDERIASDLW